MAKEFSPNPIRPTDDWSIDTRNNLPYSGQSIQNYIKSSIAQSVGAAYFDQSNFTLYFFNNSNDRDLYAADNTRKDLIVSSTALNLSSDMFRVLVTNNLPSYDIQVATNVETVLLSLGFDVQTKTITDTSWTSTGAGVNVKTYIDSGATGNYLLVPNSSKLLIAGQTYELDVRSLLQTGANRVKVTFESENDNTVTSSVVYSITLSEMYIEEFANTWYNAIVEGDSTNYKLGGFKIVGSLSKTLHIEIYQGSSKLLQFEKLIGIASYVDTPYIFTDLEGLNLQGLPTGVYICKAYLTSGNLESLPVSYNFMYVASGDKLTAQLVCVNNVASKVYNYSTASLCNYAIYNAGFSTGTPHITIQLWSGTNPTTKVNNDYAGTTTGEYFNISMGESSQVQSIPIDNSSVYPAETGADFYINATTRSNNDSNKLKIVNEATTPTSEITATWENMAWVDGIDGWTTDNEGRRALVIPADSKCIIPYKAMQGDNMTFEINFKVSNVSDYDENIITIAENPLLPGFKGIRIKPTQITIHSGADTNATNDIIRSKSFEDEQTVHLLITIQNSFGGNTGRNLVTLYINGCKALQFDYANGVSWEHNGDFILGSTSADLYVYSCRVYKKVLGVKQAEQNYINSLRTLSDREAASAWFNSIINENTHELLYEKVVNSPYNYNFFVMEMKDGATVPSRANLWAKDTKGYSDFEMHFGAHPEWDFKLFNVETSGQGTTSMDYYRWNIRWRIDKSNSDKKIQVAYYDSPTMGLDGKKVYNIQPSSLSKTVFFDGGANNSVQKHPALMRITAKTNFASSMQSHKIGATLAYTALHDAIGLRNEAQIYADSNGLPRPSVAVYEYPAFGFAKNVSQMGIVTYEFIGLFTIGPDKGDKPTFGYNISDDIKQNLITIEGTDHSRRMAKFQYPWNNEVEYRASNECLNIVLGNNSFDNGWEIANCHDLSTDKASDQAAIQTVLETEFKPAYDVAWNNSTLIFPIALNDSNYGGANAAEVLANVNADSENFRAAQYNNRFGNADMEFWIEGEYVLYHYDIVTNQFEPGINLVTQNGTPSGNTLDEQNEWFKTKRRERFFTQAPNYWDIQDCAYHFAFCLAVGATDNFAKNSYPYKMATLSNGGKWKWRQDDLDTIFDTDNRGSDSKPYYIEFEDAENGSVVFAGSTSVFWNLLYEVFWNDYDVNKGIESIGKDVVYAMASLGGGSNTYSGIINFFKKYFWNNAQEFFPQSAYNIDAAWKYETAWLTNGQAVAPLTQSLGRHLEAEHLWCSRRAIYMMSLFKAGAFAQYSDTSLGQITFRPQSLASITVTPMMWIYPALANGAGSPETTARTQDGQSYTFVGPFGTDGQTTFYIQASNYLRSVGDWKDLQLANQYVDNIDIVGSKLRTFKIGDEDAYTDTIITPAVYYTAEEIANAVEGDDAYGKTTNDIKTPAVYQSNVTTNVPSLTFNNTKCLEEIDARNASSLTGTLDLSVCTRLKRAYLEGTHIAQVTLPSGSKIRTLHLGESTTAILLKNLKFLTDFELPDDVSTIETIQIENCTTQDTFGILTQLFNSEDSALKYIRIIWSDPAEADATDITMLATIAANKKKDGTENIYRGINPQGNIEGAPVIEGTINMSTGLYTTDLDPLGITLTEDYPGGLKRAVCSTFGTLYIIYDPTRIYINFEDDAVRDICVANWSSDGLGVSMNDAAAVTNITTRFKNNTNIETFDEFKYFTGLTSVGPTGGNDGAFQGCTKLKYINLPPSIQRLGTITFSGCRLLERLGLNAPLSGNSTLRIFEDCVAMSRVDVPSIKTWLSIGTYSQGVEKDMPFYASTAAKRCVYINGVEMTNPVIPQDVTIIPAYAFNKLNTITDVTFHNNITSIGKYAFTSCPSLVIDSLNLPNLTSLDVAAFYGAKVKTITSLGSITQLKDAAFKNCTQLTSINFPTTLTYIADSFDGCSNLVIEELNLPNVTTLGQYAFRGTKVRKIINLNALTSIGADAFANCTELTEVVFPPALENTNTIDKFRGCTALEKFHIIDIAKWAGMNCSNLSLHPFGSSVAASRGIYINNVLQKDIVIPSGVNTIGNAGFYGNNTIETINIPSSVTTIANSAFLGCTSLQKVLGLGSITAIAIKCFNGCSSLEEITIPTTLTTINGGSTFTGCTSMSKLHVNSIEDWIKVSGMNGDDHAPFYASTAASRGLYVNNVLQTNITVPNTITTLPARCFYKMNTIQSITVPSSVTTIGSKAFYGTTALTDLTINTNIFGELTQNTGNGTGTLTINGKLMLSSQNTKNIGNYSHIIINGDVEHTANYCSIIGQSNIKSVRISGNILNHGVSYGLCSCTVPNFEFLEIGGQIDSILFYSYTSPYSITPSNPYIMHLKYNGIACSYNSISNGNVGATNYIFNYVSKIYVDSQEVLDQYLADTNGWANQSSKFDLWSNYNGEYRLFVCSNEIVAIYNVTDTSDATPILYSTDGITSMLIEDQSVALATSYTFPSTGIYTVKYTISNPTTCPASMFYGITALTGVALPNEMTTLPYANSKGVFENSGVQRVKMDGVTSIGNNCFNGCTNLTEVNISSAVTSIGANAFKNCSNLSGTVKIPSSVTTFGGNVNWGTFEGCSNLSNLYCYSTKEIRSDMIKSCGNGTGVLYHAGILRGTTNTANTHKFQTAVIRTIRCQGNLGALFSNTLKSIYVQGNVSEAGTSYSAHSILNCTAGNCEFIEVMGTITLASGKIVFQANALASAGAVLHLGYNGIACSPTTACADYSRITKIYVGDGSSTSADQAVLDQYLADSAWAAYSSKLDLWYNYTGNYKYAPTIPEE